MFPTCLGVLLDSSAITFVRATSANRAFNDNYMHIVSEQFHNQDNTEQFAAAIPTLLVSQEGELCFMHYIYHDMVMVPFLLHMLYVPEAWRFPQSIQSSMILDKDFTEGCPASSIGISSISTLDSSSVVVFNSITSGSFSSSNLSLCCSSSPYFGSCFCLLCLASPPTDFVVLSH